MVSLRTTSCIYLFIPHTAQDVTLADLEWHKRELLRKVHIETLITGNVTEQVRVGVRDRSCSHHYNRGLWTSLT